MRARTGLLGVFDSGVGGLTVVRALQRRLPGAHILYVADQAHVPYGGRPLDEVHGFACGISAFLTAQGCEAVVMACNISSATALDHVAALLAPLPVLGVIRPAALRATAPSPAPGTSPPTPLVGREGEHRRIGVIATEGTVKSGAYAAEITRRCPAACVTQVPCPKLVPLVEAGALDTPEADAAVREYLAPLAAARCETVILGCTHYPFLLPALRRAACDLFPAPVAFVDPADEMADTLLAALPDLETAAPTGSHRLLSTGDPAVFRAQARRFLPDTAFVVGSARWREGNLVTERRGAGVKG